MVDGGVNGVVVVQGTDTIEETAYLLDLYWDLREPLVVSGAMRAPSAAGADGPANLLAAIVVAASAAARDRGALVVLNDDVHVVGSEQDLLARGVLPAGWLDARKARLLLWALLAAGAGPEAVRATVTACGRAPGGPPA